MNEEMFNELMESVRQGGAILRGEMQPSRVYHFDAPDIKGIREKYRLSQSQFASMLGISVRTLHNWEQGRRTPVGPARVLLEVAATHPEALLDTVKGMQSKEVKSDCSKIGKKGRRGQKRPCNRTNLSIKR